jgi:predicted RNase H-like nuclease (RuvC/YqgF family)
LTTELEVANKRFEALVKHAESKLEEANVEIARVRSAFEKELVQAKSKTSRLEIQNNTLQQSLENKIKENQELMKICDGLEKYFDNK